MKVPLGFWPDGLRIAIGASVEILPWDRLSEITQVELIAAVDRVAGFVDWRNKPRR